MNSDGTRRSDLPEQWAWGTVADTGGYVNGVAFKPSDWTTTGRPIIRIQNLTDPGKQFNRTHRKVDPVYEVRDGDILVSWSATLDAFFWRGEDALLNQHIFKVYPNKDLVEKPFLYHLLRHAIDEMKRSEHMHGTTMRHINRCPFLAFPVPIAPKPEQERIADKLDELLSDLDKGVEALERVRRNLERYRASVLKAAVEGRLTEEWRAEHPDVEPASELLKRILAERRRRWEEAELAKYEVKGRKPPKNWRDRYKEPVPPDTTGLPDLPKGWVWTAVDALLVASLCNGISIKGSDSPPGVPALKLNAMGDTGFDYNAIRYIPIDEGTSRALAVQENDFFVSRGNGSIRLVGRGTLAQEPPFLIVFPDLMIRARLSDAILHTRWLPSIWPSRLVRRQIEKRVKTTAGIWKIAQPQVASITVPLPPNAEQEAIGARLDKALSVAAASDDIVQGGLKRSSRLRQSILKAAFEGRLVPQDPNDEPASALLERIRAAKAAEKPASKPRRKAKTRKGSRSRKASR